MRKNVPNTFLSKMKKTKLIRYLLSKDLNTQLFKNIRK